MDIHEDGSSLYPGTGFESENGSGKGKGTKLNLSLSSGATDHDFIANFTKVEDFISSLKCELIIFQCGADGLKGDPLTHLQYTHKAHKFAAEVLHEYAHKMCSGRIIGLGGGGYNTENIRLMRGLRLSRPLSRTTLKMHNQVGIILIYQSRFRYEILEQKQY